jgi:hypothetical protein
LYPKAAADSAEESPPPATEAALPSTPLPPENAAVARARADALRAAADADLEERAATPVAADDEHLVGAPEFRPRDRAHRRAGQARARHLARNHTATTAPA